MCVCVYVSVYVINHLPSMCITCLPFPAIRSPENTARAEEGSNVCSRVVPSSCVEDTVLSRDRRQVKECPCKEKTCLQTMTKILTPDNS